MKYATLFICSAIATFSLTSCGNGENNETAADSTTMETPVVTSDVIYYDLATGAALHKDEGSGRYVTDQGTPAKFYVDVQALDTFYGPSGDKVNTYLVNDNNDWKLDESRVKITDNKIVIENDETKLKIKEEKSKLITDDQKIKVTDRDGDGVKEVKVKDR